MVDSTLGVYEVLEEVGRGGMATVYRARHAGMDRVVALKVLKQSFAGDPDALARFQREARLIARLEHPHLLPVYDFDGAHDPPYIAMRYVESGTLKDLLRRGRLGLGEAAHLLDQVASALDYAHRQGVVHRDIKPSNVMLDGEGNAFLADFGLARVALPDREGEGALTLPGTVLGTPSYMSPEQAVGAGTVDRRADLYALGVLLFEMVTGTLPFPGDNPVEVAMAHVGRPVPSATERDPSLPPAVDAVIRRAMAKRPEDRYDSAAALSREVQRLAGQAISAAPSSLREAVRDTAGRLEALRQGAIEATISGSRAMHTPRPASDSHATPGEHHRLVTAVYANLSECAALLAEEGSEGAGPAMNTVMAALERVAEAAGGRVEQRTQDALLILWGAERSREDDAEHAVGASLEMMEALRSLGPVKEGPPPMQVGITTGRVLLVPAPGTGRSGASGGAVVGARRMERAAPPGSVLLSSETYRLVRYTVEVEAGVKLPATERQPAAEAFVAKAYRPSALGREPSGVSDSSSRMIFRGGELERLRKAFLSAGREGRTRLLALTARPGLGKARLVADFVKWLAKERLPYILMSARATSATSARPYRLVAELLTSEAGAGGPEELAVRVTEALQGGPFDPAETAGVLAQLVRGGDGDDPTLYARAGSGPDALQERAALHLSRYLERLGRRGVVVLVLADIHRADAPSLELLDRLSWEHPHLPLLVISTARPDLFERMPDWGQSCPGFERVDLEPLPRRQAAAFAHELLAEVRPLPEELVEFVVDRAEGSPLYIEELIQILWDEGVLVRGASGAGVHLEGLRHLHAPASLTGILQARLDALGQEERVALQRAAVLGRTFWDEGVAALEPGDGVALREPGRLLAGLADRALVEARSTSSVPGALEFSFGSALLREVVLESIPKRLLRAYHACAGHWLAGHASDRPSDRAASIGEHLEEAGEVQEAARYLSRAGEYALAVSAFADARRLLERACAMAGESGKEEAAVRIHLAEALAHLGEYEEAAGRLEEALGMARDAGDARGQADALHALGQTALWRGDPREAERRFEESLEAADLEDQWVQARALLGLGEVAWRAGDLADARGHLEAAMALAREFGDPSLVMACLLRLGTIARLEGDLDGAAGWLDECEATAMEEGARDRLAEAMNGLGEISRDRGDAGEAKERFTQALALAEAIGLHAVAVRAEINLAFAQGDLGAPEEGGARFLEILDKARRNGETENVLCAAVGLASVVGETVGREVLRAALAHPAADELVRSYARPILSALDLEEGALNAEKTDGADFDAILSRLLGEEVG
jgi:serine/threonine protein kinase/tetratricopeptide (TPR) repeat protein